MAPASQALTLTDRKECHGYSIGEAMGPEENIDILQATESDVSSLRVLPLLPQQSLEKLTPILQDTGQAIREKKKKTLTCPAKSPHTPMIHRMLNTAEPTIVPTPTSPWVMNTPGIRKR